MGFLAQHFAKVEAQQQTQAAADPQASSQAATRTQYEQMLVKLADDRVRLKKLQSVEKKIELKREMVSSYADYLEGVMAAGTSLQDNVLVTLMMWHADIGDVGRAAALGEFALENNMVMPEGYKRSLATTLAEECADHVLKQANISDTVQALGVLQLVAQTVDIYDMPDQVRAKLHKAMGRLYKESGNSQDALVSLRRATELDKNAGVKKEIEVLERELKKADGATTTVAAACA